MYSTETTIAGVCPLAHICILGLYSTQRNVLQLLGQSWHIFGPPLASSLCIIFQPSHRPVRSQSPCLQKPNRKTFQVQFRVQLSPSHRVLINLILWKVLK